jgi:Transglycosylase-like domain
MLDRQLVRARVIARQAGYIRSLKRQISWRADWDSIARCESTHRWHLNVGIFDGGLQVQPLTWDAYGDVNSPGTPGKPRRSSRWSWQPES